MAAVFGSEVFGIQSKVGWFRSQPFAHFANIVSLVPLAFQCISPYRPRATAAVRPTARATAKAGIVLEVSGAPLGLTSVD